MTSDDTRIRLDLSKLKETSWKGYAIRFLFGGAVTAFTGWVAAKYGPVVGGLFLAFPAILPASVTLVREHENADAAGQDAYGAMLGSVGLAAFGGMIWGVSVYLVSWLALVLALGAWLVAALVAFFLDRWRADAGSGSALH